MAPDGVRLGGDIVRGLVGLGGVIAGPFSDPVRRVASQPALPVFSLSSPPLQGPSLRS